MGRCEKKVIVMVLIMLGLGRAVVLTGSGGGW